MNTKAVQHEVRHIHDLLSVRDLLADRGVAPQELRRYDAAIDAARSRLAKLARPDVVGLPAYPATVVSSLNQIPPKEPWACAA